MSHTFVFSPDSFALGFGAGALVMGSYAIFMLSRSFKKRWGHWPWKEGKSE